MPKKATPAENTVNREYKSSIFAMLFRDKTKLLELYNAISGTSYTDRICLRSLPWRTLSTWTQE